MGAKKEGNDLNELNGKLLGEPVYFARTCENMCVRKLLFWYLS